MMTDNEHLNFIDKVETMKKDIEAIKKETFNKMAVPKDTFQIKTFTIGNIRKNTKSTCRHTKETNFNT